MRAQLSAPPAGVLEIGCGREGGFVPLPSAAGYAAVGSDPKAPDAPDYRRVEFERFELTQPVHTVVACTALHQVRDVGQVMDRIAAVSVPGGSVVVVESA